MKVVIEKSDHWRRKKVPFKYLDNKTWAALALIGVFAFYTILIAADLLVSSTNSGIGADYQAFWSTGKIASQYGYSHIYDLDLLSQIQSGAIRSSATTTVAYTPNPVPFLSIFIIPFTVLSYLSAPLSFWIWTMLNMLCLGGYILFFIRWLNSRGGRTSALIPLLLITSYPVFQNFYWGQVEVWLLIFLGEFIRAFLSKKPILAGFWLAGLLLKPQLLVLIIPFLLFSRAWKILTGFSLSAIIIILISFLLSGINGFISLMRLWLLYVPGLPTNSPEFMTNWRMLGLHLNSITSSNIGWVVLVAGMLLTLIACSLLLPQKVMEENQLLMVFLGVFAATLIFTWHSHIHMGMVVVPFLLYASVNKDISSHIIAIWALIPTLLQMVILLTGLLMVISHIPFIYNFGGLILGFSGMGVDIILIYQVLKKRIIFNSEKVSGLSGS